MPTPLPAAATKKSKLYVLLLPVRLVSSQWGVLANGTVRDGQVADAAAYDAAGRLTQVRYPAGGNLWRTAVYFPWLGGDGNSNGRLAYLLVGSRQEYGDRYQTYLGYDAYGNTVGRSEFVGPDRQENYYYGYDNQNRVSAGTYYRFAPGNSSTPVYTETLTNTYQWQGGWPVHVETGDLNHYRGHFSKPVGSGYTLDGNGNVRTRPGEEFIWDAENHLVQMNWNSLTRREHYFYDEAGIRVRKAEGTPTQVTSETYYLFPHYERKVTGSTTVITKYYFLGGMLLAKSENNVLTYLHSDHLGSVVLETDTAGNIVNDQRYYAYGRRLDTGGDISGEKDFTRQRKDATGLVYMNARYYDPTLEQFISPDTIVPDPKSWLSYNRYLYANGNPVKYNDPSGHCAISEEGGQTYIAKWDCTVDDFAKLSWDERKQWMDLFMQETNFHWFQNVLGILDYFSSDADFSPLNGWASTADAAVLQAINDGYLMHKPEINGGKAIGPSGPDSASQKWKAFFDVASTQGSDARRLWGIAEQAGVDYGVQQAAPLLATGDLVGRAKADAFVEAGNIYRAMVANEVYDWAIFSIPPIQWVNTSLDPRTTMSRSFVANAAAVYVNSRMPHIVNSDICRQTLACFPP